MKAAGKINVMEGAGSPEAREALSKDNNGFKKGGAAKGKSAGKADGNQSIAATDRTGSSDTVAVDIPAGTIERFGGLGGTTFPNLTNMDFAVGSAR